MVAERRRSMAVSEMTESLQRVGERPLEPSVEERYLVSVAYGSTAGCRRAAWHIITSVEQKENPEANDVKHSPKIQSRDRILQCTVEQILDVPVPGKAEQLVEEPKTIPQDRIQQRTVEHINADTPVPQDVEEPGEFFKAFSQEKIYQETKRIEIPLLQFIIVVAQRQISMVIDVRVVSVVQVPLVQVMAETAEIAQLQVDDKMVDVPVVLGRAGLTGPSREEDG